MSTVEDRPVPDGKRRCARCRWLFPIDPTLFEPGEPAWWLCPPCEEKLLAGPRQA